MEFACIVQMCIVFEYYSNRFIMGIMELEAVREQKHFKDDEDGSTTFLTGHERQEHYHL
jgi:hypothetical protein